MNSDRKVLSAFNRVSNLCHEFRRDYMSSSRNSVEDERSHEEYNRLVIKELNAAYDRLNRLKKNIPR